VKLVAIAGSPRKNGNSNSLMRIAVEAAVERGAETEVFYARGLDVTGCLACDGCKRTPDSTCVQDDDMHGVYAAIKGCDALLLASPVYFYSLSSWIKQVIDRCYALIPPEAEEGLPAPPPRVTPGKAHYLITTQAEDSPLYGYQILSTVVYGLTWIGMVPRGELIATGLDGPHDWEKRDDLIAAARALIKV
jgi:multimeric flavodoxin WrbA